MVIKVKKKKDDDVIVKSPVADSDSPVKDFVVLIFVALTTPFIFIYSFMTGRIRSPLLVVIVFLVAVFGLYKLSMGDYVSKRDIKTKIIQQTLEEITPEEKEEMRKEISTLRKSADINLIPKPLYPIVDVPIDMLSINYLMYMIQSGYIQPDGAGSEFILDSYLHSKHKLLQEKSWEALQNIKTEASERVMTNYQAEMTQRAKVVKQTARQIPSSSIFDDISDGFKDKVKNQLDNFKLNHQ